jgi:hypothetical protein
VHVRGGSGEAVKEEPKPTEADRKKADRIVSNLHGYDPSEHLHESQVEKAEKRNRNKIALALAAERAPLEERIAELEWLANRNVEDACEVMSRLERERDEARDQLKSARASALESFREWMIGFFGPLADFVSRRSVLDELRKRIAAERKTDG